MNSIKIKTLVIRVNNNIFCVLKGDLEINKLIVSAINAVETAEQTSLSCFFLNVICYLQFFQSYLLKKLYIPY